MLGTSNLHPTRAVRVGTPHFAANYPFNFIHGSSRGKRGLVNFNLVSIFQRAQQFDSPQGVQRRQE